MFNKILQYIFNLTHRIKHDVVTTKNLSSDYRYIPQWWFIWWHNYDYSIGYDFYIPRSYETLQESRSFLDKKNIWLYVERQKLGVKPKYFKYKE